MRRLFLIAILFAGPLSAADFKPYPDAAISAEQWQQYFDTVWLEFADTMQELPDANLVVFQDESTSTWYAFTTANNPAHPAWVTRRIVQQDGALAMEQVGYFAGDEEPFADLFDAYSDISDEMREQFEAQQAADATADE